MKLPVAPCYECNETRELVNSRCAACHSRRHTATEHDLDAARGKLDIIQRYCEGEYILDDDASMLANDYGGTGWEQDPIVRLVQFRLIQLKEYGEASVQASGNAPFKKRPIDPAAEPKFYVTYGMGSNLKHCYSVVSAPNAQEARRIVDEVTLGKFSFFYPEEQFTPQIQKYKLKEVPLQPQILAREDHDDIPF